MSICRGCGMVLGRDCFNEQDCMWISQSMQQMYEQEQCSQAEDQDVNALHDRIKHLEQELANVSEQLASANEQLAEAEAAIAAQAQQPTELSDRCKVAASCLTYNDTEKEAVAKHLLLEASQELRRAQAQQPATQEEKYLVGLTVQDAGGNTTINWHGKHPYSFPVGTKFFALPPAPEGE